MQPLSARITDFTVKETNVTKSTKTVIETRPVETNQYFRFLQECLDWVDSQLVRLKFSSEMLRAFRGLLQLLHRCFGAVLGSSSSTLLFSIARISVSNLRTFNDDVIDPF